MLFLLGSGLTGVASAHDFWLEAHPFYTTPAKSVDISVHVGTDFNGDSLPNIPEWYSDFSVYGGSLKQPLSGELGRDPAGYFTPQQTGTYAIGYQSTYSYVEIDAATFLKYAQQEGLDNAMQYRREHGLQNRMAKENYIRHAKALVQSGDQFDIDQSARVFGYTLEIVPQSNPYRKKPGASLAVQVLFRGVPAADILLHAIAKNDPADLQQIRTDRQGRATIKLDRAGPWLLKAVKIVRIKEGKADWQSHWASLTFAVR